MLVDTRGYRDPDAGVTDAQLTLELVRFLRDNALRVRLVIVMVTDLPRASPLTSAIISFASGLHPHMRERLHLWIATNRVQVHHLYNAYQPAIAASNEPFPYSFGVEYIRSLLAEPLSPKWEIDRCTHCYLKGDRRLLTGKPCLRHQPKEFPHDIQFVGGTQKISTSHPEHYHPGHFRGFLYGNTWSCCGRQEACTCKKCCSPVSSLHCTKEVTGESSTKACKRCSLPNKLFCYEACKFDHALTDAPCSVVAGAEHDWVRITP